MKLRRGKERKGISKFLYKLRLKWKFGVVHGWYDFKAGTKSLINWLPAVWKYRSWDGSYTIDMIIQSLEFQRDRLKNHSREIEETLLPKIEEIELVIALLKKTQDESNYTKSIYEHYDSLYGEEEMYFEPFEKTKEDREALGEFDDKGNILYRMRFSREDSMSEEEYEKYREEKSKKLIEADKMRDEDRKKAFSIMAEKIETWWE